MQISKLQLDQCQNCKKRGFGKTGVICSLTEEKEEFQGKCPQFELDEKVEKFNKRIYATDDLGIWGGILLIAGGGIWSLMSLIYLHGVGLIPLFMIISGFASLLQGNHLKKKKKKDSDIIDDEVY